MFGIFIVDCFKIVCDECKDFYVDVSIVWLLLESKKGLN